MWLLMSLFWGCSELTEIIPIPDTTARIDAVAEVNQRQSELKLHIMTDPEDCAYITEDSDEYLSQQEYDACLPWVDRQAGEIKLGVRFELDDQFYQLPDLNDNISVSLNDRQVVDNASESDVRVVGHKPRRISQLFVLIIDGSASMNTVDAGSDKSRMDKVRDALLMRSVQEAFFPDDPTVTNHVLVYTFTSGTPQPLGGELRVLSNKRAYKSLIQGHLSARAGYTHLYNAVDYGLNTVLQTAEVQSLLDGQTKPTLVVLTDGFNNEAARDTCISNVPRLQRLLVNIRKEMDDFAVDTPLIFTVGLGRPLSRRFNPKRVKFGRVSDRELCAGQSHNKLIDAPGDQIGFEDLFIDNVSLELIADRGKGRAFVEQDAKGLGEAFEEVAAIRYEWFEVMFRDNALKFRREFNVGLQLNNYARAVSSVNIYPHAWMDGPHGPKDSQGWSTRSSMWHSASILTSGLGVLLFLLTLGAAVFNVKRLAMGRLHRERNKIGSQKQ